MPVAFFEKEPITKSARDKFHNNKILLFYDLSKKKTARDNSLKSARETSKVPVTKIRKRCVIGIWGVTGKKTTVLEQVG